MICCSEALIYVATCLEIMVAVLFILVTATISPASSVVSTCWVITRVLKLPTGWAIQI